MKNIHKLFWTALSVLSAILIFYRSSKNNVCKSYSDYFFIHTSENCWHEVGVYAEVPQIVLQRNHTLETYYSVTEDGFFLRTFRLLPKGKPKGVIFLEHSFIANSEIWIDIGDQSLGFYLLNEGYEIWLGNMRGSKYSNTHEKYTTSDFEFWDWSFHEQGVYDISSQLDVVKKITNRSDIIFISYSMGGTSSIVYASLRPEHAKKSVKAMIHFAPIVYLSHLKGFGAILSNWTTKSRFWDMLNWLRIGWLPHGPVLNYMKSIVCNSHPLKFLCLKANEVLIGQSKTEIDPIAAPTIIEKFPDASSTKSIHHFTQIHQAGGKLRQYDYGYDGNRKMYNATIPPLYPLENIRIPFFMYHGSEDSFTDLKDIESFYEDLPPEAKMHGHKQVDNYNHFDLMFGKHRERDIYKHLLKLLRSIL
ncbi:lysosomal acid lipase/cholesteryl ester hydrolase-like [Harmonia axyridis]|uniref:lysosomal acid lipase/cholesteryl ester hydrolase-like n=1 Tax=Harmonia axyridis TaxID=115357 RepID=UPI001E277BBD|nr:lysosomal acid lipase/cholesteryl ester hydrolase-like [Harmonia axyridis]